MTKTKQILDFIYKRDALTASFTTTLQKDSTMLRSEALAHIAGMDISHWSIWTSAENLEKIREYLNTCQNLYIAKPDFYESDNEAEHCIDIHMIYTPKNGERFYSFLSQQFPDLKFIVVREFSDDLNYPDLVQLSIPDYQHKNYDKASSYSKRPLTSLCVDFIHYDFNEDLEFLVVNEGVFINLCEGDKKQWKFRFGMKSSTFFHHISILEKAVEDWERDVRFDIDQSSDEAKESWKALFDGFFDWTVE